MRLYRKIKILICRSNETFTNLPFPNTADQISPFIYTLGTLTDMLHTITSTFVSSIFAMSSMDMPSPKGYSVAALYIRDVCDVRHALIHTYASDDRRLMTIYDDLALVGQVTAVAVCKSYRKCGDLCRSFSDKSSAVSISDPVGTSFTMATYVYQLRIS